MSMELYVLSDERLGSIAEWQHAIDAEGFPLRLSEETSFDALNGFLPAKLNGNATGFECDHWQAGELMAEASDIDLAHHYWRERSEEFATTEGRLKMRNELEEDTHAFRRLDRDIEAATKPVRAKLGIEDDVMDEYVRVSLERIKAGLPLD